MAVSLNTVNHMKILRKLALIIVLFLSLSAFSVTSLNDPLSQQLRTWTEHNLNQAIENLTVKAEHQQLNWLDKTVLHSALWLGCGIAYWQYPEASKILWHYVYGQGEALTLDAEYFQQSDYLKQQIQQLGQGKHGPLTLKQAQDWRLSLALNPYYLDITSNDVRIYHPHIAFAPLNSTRTYTILPLGYLRLRLYDNLIQAFNPKPFAVSASWKR